MKRIYPARWARTTAMALLLAAMSLMASTNAVRADDLKLGSHYNIITGILTGSLSGGDPTVGGGSITPSFLNGSQLPWVYCVDYLTQVAVPGDYTGSVVTDDGTIHHQGNGNQGAVISVSNAGQVAWLLNTYADAALGNDNAQAGLQAAIWHTIYGNDYVLDTAHNNAAIVAAYNADLVNVGTLSLSSVRWLSPSFPWGGVYQGLVTSIPEPSFCAMAGLLGMGGIGLLRRRRAQA